MDFYLTSLATGDRFRFPITPDRLNVKTGPLFVSLQIINVGDVKIPRGNTLTGYSWNSTFPEARLKDYCFVHDWQEPTRIVEKLKAWESSGETLRFMVTELSINTNVYIETFTYDYYTVGDCAYTINLIEKRDMTVTTTYAPPIIDDDAEELTGEDDGKRYGYVVQCCGVNIREGPGTDHDICGQLEAHTRVEILDRIENWYKIHYPIGSSSEAYVHASYITSTLGQGGFNGEYFVAGSAVDAETAKVDSSTTSGTGGRTYVVNNGDSLWLIAVSELGDSSRMDEIYQLNKTAIDAANAGQACDKYTIRPGLVLILPEKNTTEITSYRSKAVEVFNRSLEEDDDGVPVTIEELIATKPSSVQVDVSTTKSRFATPAVTNTGSNLFTTSLLNGSAWRK